jgi:flagellar basal-body rod protein FlgF
VGKPIHRWASLPSVGKPATVVGKGTAWGKRQRIHKGEIPPNSFTQAIFGWICARPVSGHSTLPRWEGASSQENPSMQSGLYVGLSAQMALERRLNTVADNMANMNTVGFRATEVKFDELLSGIDNNISTNVSFVSQGNDYLSTQSGELQKTDNPLDFAVKGDAWLAVDTPSGQVLTRDGRFTMAETGELLSMKGYPVLDSGGGAIQLDRNGGPPSVGVDGRIFQNGRAVASIGLFQTDLSKGFLRYDNSGILPSGGAQPVVDDKNIGVLQGYIEQSNVNGISEMTQLISINRNFESISSMMSSTENSFTDAIKTLGGSQ